MKYFTRDELEDITKELIENPTRETLKKLNDKYNKIELGIDKTIPNASVEPPIVAPIETTKIEEKKATPDLPPVIEENKVVSPIPNISIPNAETSKDVSFSGKPTIPSFELPKLETPISPNNIQNNQPINLTGNLWDAQMSNSNNLMQTTDNFNSVTNTMSSTEVPVENGLFFGSSQSSVNNSIPIAGAPTNQEPTMFGQFEKNYM